MSAPPPLPSPPLLSSAEGRELTGVPIGACMAMAATVMPALGSQPVWVGSCWLYAPHRLSFRGPRREDISFAQCVFAGGQQLSRADPQLAGSWTPSAGRNEGTLSDPTHHSAEAGTAGTSGPGLCLQPWSLGKNGGFSSPAPWSCSGHSPAPASLLSSTPGSSNF